MTYHTSIKQQLEQIQQADQGRLRKKILILGAGMAGLAAGYELAQRGHQVQIFEAERSRLGGRVWTRKFKNGQYGELGAMRIPAAHDYTRHYIKLLNLQLRKFINFNETTYRDFEETICRANVAGQTIGDLFDLSQRDRDAIKQENDLDAIYIRMMEDVWSGLDEADKVQLFGHGPLSANLSQLDTSLLQTLRHSADTEDAVRLIGKVTVLDNYWQRSTLMFLREEIEGAFVGLEEIQGGTDLLPQALANAPLPDGTTLQDHIYFSREVYSIEQGNQGITVTFKQEGKLDTATFSYVLCTIPFSVLRRIDIKGLPNGKKIVDAIQGLGYHSATKVLVNCTKRFWELDQQGAIYGGASLSDSIARMTFYPSDNEKEKNQAISNGPGVLLGSYSWGANARRLGALNPPERGEVVVDKIRRFHPQITDYIDPEEPYASIAWDQHPFAAGAFASPSPIDLQMFFPGASQPAGRLFFAGEHLSPYTTWIQGALWSALQAVMQIVKA
ncbi:MAG: FAD-dependent oxidoreductase [Aphanocapsa sp. GSE-SYN-MK-11-07L]|jgi:monoamine oxidase|nr:FAD-dependent oxidoreductase [Aphanocapsa sp. GSE-SYN-MK-11-07L]